MSDHVALAIVAHPDDIEMMMTTQLAQISDYVRALTLLRIPASEYS